MLAETQISILDICWYLLKAEILMFLIHIMMALCQSAQMTQYNIDSPFLVQFHKQGTRLGVVVFMCVCICVLDWCGAGCQLMHKIYD